MQQGLYEPTAGSACVDYPLCLVHHKAMTRSADTTPVDYIIEIFGGVRALARGINQTHVSVINWRKSHNGAGLVPTHIQGRILELARKRGLKLTADDFIVLG